MRRPHTVALLLTLALFASGCGPVDEFDRADDGPAPLDTGFLAEQEGDELAAGGAQVTEDPGRAPDRPPIPRPPTGASEPVSAQDLLDSLGVPVGYGASTTGGAAGDVVLVTTLAGDGPGSLREAVSEPGPRWVRFAVSGTIRLGPPIKVASDITIDGRGQDITISGHSVEIVGTNNIIITNIAFADGPIGASRDSITMLQDAHDIWVDHCSFTGTPDELISVASGATDITLSWNRFHDHGKAILIGTREGEGNERTRVTVHHNFFDETVERNPRLTATTVHAFNNYVYGWGSSGMSAVRGGSLLAEANVFEPTTDDDAIIAKPGRDDDEGGGYVKAVDNVVIGEADIVERMPEQVIDPNYDYEADLAGQALADLIRAGAGPTLGDG